MTCPDDRALVERAQAGDAEAFEALIQPHVAIVRRFTYSFCSNWADADDLAQEALIRAFRAIGSFRGDAAITTWLYAVVRSACIDWTRSRQTKTRAGEEALYDERVDPQDAQDALLEGKAEAEQLWRAIRKLDPRFRVALVLFDIEGMQYGQIAAIEHVPIGTVRSRLARARRQLREILTGNSFGPVAGPGSGTETAEATSNQRKRPAS